MNYVEMRLIKLSKGGDRAAFSELVDMYKDKIYHLAYRMLNQRQESEDVVQETFLRVYTNLDRYDEAQKFSTWIYRIATNLCIDRLRKRKINYSLDAGIAADEDTDWYEMLPSQEKTPEQHLLLSETKIAVHQAIQSLPEKYKAVMILRYIHDLSLQEIGDILEMPVSTVKTRVHRGREFLRKKLNQHIS